VVPEDHELHCKIMQEAHCSRYSIHPGTNKIYQDFKKSFWWTQMKREIAKYVSECDTCRRVKADHLRPAGNLQPLSIPVEMGKDMSRLHCGFAPHHAGVKLDMGHCGSLDEVHPLYTCIYHLEDQTVCRVISVAHHPLPWHTKDHYLGETASVFGHPSHSKLSLSPSN
jgi:hypothetical protein